jgi:hypothetical protein
MAKKTDPAAGAAATWIFFKSFQVLQPTFSAAKALLFVDAPFTRPFITSFILHRVYFYSESFWP